MHGGEQKHSPEDSMSDSSPDHIYRNHDATPEGYPLPVAGSGGLGYAGEFGNRLRAASLADSIGSGSLPGFDAVADASIMSDVVGEQYATGYSAGYASGFAAGYAAGAEEGVARARSSLRAADAAGLLSPGALRTNKLAIPGSPDREVSSTMTTPTVDGLDESEVNGLVAAPSGSPVRPMRRAVPLGGADNEEDARTPPRAGKNRGSGAQADGTPDLGAVLGSAVDVAVTLGIVAIMRPVLGWAMAGASRRRRKETAHAASPAQPPARSLPPFWRNIKTMQPHAPA